MRILLICNYKPGVGGISGQVELLRDHLRAEDHEAEIFSTKGSPLWRLGLLRRLRREGKGYDRFHIHCCSGWGFLPAVVGIRVGRRLGKHVVLTYHGGGADRFFDKHPQLVKKYLRQTDANIVMNQFLADVFARHGLDCTVIPNIIPEQSQPPAQVDPPADATSHSDTTPVDRPRYICLRSHEPLYDNATLLEAFAQVVQQMPGATLTLVGDGSQHDALRQQASQLGLDGKVRFVGRVDNSEVPALLQEADVMVSASTVDNMPVSVLEGMAAGLLVIATHVGGVPEMIRNNQTGLLFEPGNVRQLADKMLWAAQNPTIAQAIAAQGRRQASLYQWSGVKDKLMQQYQTSHA